MWLTDACAIAITTNVVGMCSGGVRKTAVTMVLADLTSLFSHTLYLCEHIALSFLQALCFVGFLYIKLSSQYTAQSLR